MNKPLNSYLKSIAALTRRGGTSEGSYYLELKTLLENIAQAQKRTVQVTVLPKPTEAGNPDFRVWDGSRQVIGYIEAKAPGAKLDQVETSRYIRIAAAIARTMEIQQEINQPVLFTDADRLKSKPFQQPWANRQAKKPGL